MRSERESAWLCRMKTHDPLRIANFKACQYWWALRYLMQLHENRYTKRAGVAGLRARADGSIDLNANGEYDSHLRLSNMC